MPKPSSPIKVNGQVVDHQNKALAFSTVSVGDGSHGVVCDADGRFELALPLGSYVLHVQSLGFETLHKTVVVRKKGKVKFLFTLEPSSESIDDVDVVAKSKNTQVKELPFAITSIDTKPLVNTSRDINQVLKTTTGVNVREEGGLGSGFNLSINGLSGKQVKFFIDGVPMENFGSALTLNNFPVSMVDRIEVFKGVVPIWLGADALGGAINIVTNQSKQSFVDASYSTGSFNTHRLALSGRWYAPKSGLVVNTNAFYNYSDNNYWVDVDIVDWETGKIKKEERVKRFHDSYWSYMVQAEVGLVNKSWADHLFLGFLAADNQNNIQHGTRMQDVYGQVYSTSSTLMPSLKFKNTQLLNNKLSVQLYASFIKSQSLIADTSSNQYNWYGEYVVNADKTIGEMGWQKTLFSFNDQVFSSSFNAAYQLGSSDKYNIKLNHTINHVKREGEDAAKEGFIPFDEPNNINKQVSGLALGAQFFDKRLRTTVFSKFYNYNATIIDVSNSQEVTELNPTYAELGYGFAATWFIKPYVQLKSSLEKAYRLPEAYEVFGDGANLLPNPDLKPETSLNFNIGTLYNRHINRHHWLVDANVFCRNSSDFIRQEATGKNSQFVNVRDVLSTGVEGELSYAFNRFINAGVNLTWQNIVNKTKYENGTISHVYNDRIPNVPYLFGNATVGLRHAKLINDSDEVNIRWSCRYVEQYYLRWPSQGAKKYNIPQQFAQSAELNYSWANGKHNFSLQCNNISNAKLYDNYMVQLPSRAFYLKYRFFIQSSKH